MTQLPRFALIGCSKTKAPRATVAAALYRGDLFRRAMEYARLRGLMTAILSAEYGLVHLDRVIAPYDTTLSAMSAHARERWSLKVAAQVLDMVPNGAGVVLLCGELYRAPFERGLILRPYEVPMRGLGIGHQRAWLARETARLAAERGAA